MSRRITVPLAAIAVLLVPLGASASLSAKQAYTPPALAGFAVIGKNRTADVQWDMLAQGPMVVRLYLVDKDKFLQLWTGTTKYQTLKKRLVIKQAGRNIVLPAGTKYWVYGKKATSWWRQRTHVFVRVRNNAPLRARDGKPMNLCLAVYAHSSGRIPTGATWTQGSGKISYCMTTRRWLARDSAR